MRKGLAQVLATARIHIYGAYPNDRNGQVQEELPIEFYGNHSPFGWQLIFNQKLTTVK